MDASSNDDMPTQDWVGAPVDCGPCPHLADREALGCVQGHCCVQDAYARRIDRFFRRHPTLALQHLGHPYFEVRAIAARHVDMFHLNALRNDADETVRMQVALRLPVGQLPSMCDDEHREVRIRVAHRLAIDALGRMVADPDYEVRRIVARRLPVTRLSLLAGDIDEQVRGVMAERLPMPALWAMAGDASELVRRTVARRVPQTLLAALVDDPDWMVRWYVAHRADRWSQYALLRRLVEDQDVEVRAEALARLNSVGHGIEVPEGDCTEEVRHG